MHYRCPCCGAHAREAEDADAPCPLCRWAPRGAAGYTLNEARENVRLYGVFYRPADPAFAVIRHPILGPRGEYAVDRVALRMRAFLEFAAFARGRGESAMLTERLNALLTCIRSSDMLYTK